MVKTFTKDQPSTTKLESRVNGLCCYEYENFPGGNAAF